MSGVWMLGRAEIRRRIASIILLVVIVGLVGTIVLATVAGARRSHSALTRFNAYSRAGDTQILTGYHTTPDQLDKFLRTPGIADVATLDVYVVVPVLLPDKLMAAAVDTKFGTTIDRDRLVAGRRANPAVADELTVSESFAALLHLHAGSELRTVSMTASQFDRATTGGNPGPPAGPSVLLHVVGIVRRPLDLGDRGTVGGVIVLTPAFNRAYGNEIAHFSRVLRLRVARPADLARVDDAARTIFGHNPFASVQPTADDRKGADDAINVLTLALWIFALIVAFAGIVALTVVMSRAFACSRADQDTLRSLGLTKRRRVAVGLPRALLIATAGALLAGIGAAAASPLFPVGVARRADPHPGLRLDGPVLAVGMLAVAAVVLAVAWVTSVRSITLASSARLDRAHHRKPAIADLAASAGLRPTLTNGLRMATQPGGGEGAVPLRSAFVAIVFGVAALAAVVVFSASLRHVVDTPRLYGQTWDFAVTDNAGEGGATCPHADFGVQRVAGVRAVTSVCTQTSLINGRSTNVWGLTTLRGDIGPTVVAGRAPRGDNEIALGATTMSALHTRIGGSVTVRGPHEAPSYLVVGQIVLADLSDSDPQPLADGATLAEGGFNRILDTNNVSHYIVGRFATGANRAEAERRINALAFAPSDAVVFDVPPRYQLPVPAEVGRLRDIEWFPAIGAVFLAALALVALAHALTTAVRRRRRDLALLKALGFDRAQIRATVAWQASTLALVGLVLGLPAGVLFGTVAWRAVAHQLGVTATADAPSTLLLAIPLVLLFAIVVSTIPASLAARIPPAVMLATE